MVVLHSAPYFEAVKVGALFLWKFRWVYDDDDGGGSAAVAAAAAVDDDDRPLPRL